MMPVMPISSEEVLYAQLETLLRQWDSSTVVFIFWRLVKYEEEKGAVYPFSTR